MTEYKGLAVLFYRLSRGKYYFYLKKSNPNLPIMASTWSPIGDVVVEKDIELFEEIRKKHGDIIEDMMERIAVLRISIERNLFDVGEKINYKKSIDAYTILKKTDVALLSVWLHSMIPWGYYEISDGDNLFKMRYYLFISPTSPSLKRMKAKQKSHLYDIDGYILEDKTKWISAQELFKMYKELDSLVSSATIYLISQIIMEKKKIYEVAREIESRKNVVSAISNQILPFIWKFTFSSTSFYQTIKSSNCYVIGNKIKYIIDPGSKNEEELGPLISMIEEAPNQYEGILITDHHPYSCNRAGFLKKKFNIPIYTSQETSDLLKKQEIEVNFILQDKDILYLNDTKSGIDANTWYLEVIKAPGHTKGSLAFYDSRGILFTGDTIIKDHFTIVDPEQGCISDLVESLRKLKKYRVKFGLANQGETIIKLKKRVLVNIYFRKKILNKIYESMKKGNETADDIVKDLIPLVPEELQSGVKWGVIMFLKMLNEKEAVVKRGENYILKKKIRL